MKVEMQERDLEELVRKVIAGLSDSSSPIGGASTQVAASDEAVTVSLEDDVIPDISAIDYRFTYDVPNAVNPDEFRRLKERTWARIGLGRVGPRYKTGALLRFWADNALASIFHDGPDRGLSAPVVSMLV